MSCESYGRPDETTLRKNETSAQVGVAPSSKLDLSDDGDRQWDGRIVWDIKGVTFVLEECPTEHRRTPWSNVLRKV